MMISGSSCKHPFLSQVLQEFFKQSPEEGVAEL